MNRLIDYGWNERLAEAFAGLAAPPRVPARVTLEYTHVYRVVTTDGETHISGFAKAKARLDALIAAKHSQPECLAPWTLHDLRRTVGTHMARLGITKDVRARVLNHAMQGVTDRAYNVFDYASDKRSALDRWAAEIMRAVEGKPAGKVVKIRGGR